MLAATITALLMLPHLAHAHGFMYGPNGLKDDATLGAVRNFNRINNGIDALRNKVNDPSIMCNGTPVSKRVDVSFGGNGDSHTIALALSLGAQHIGECHVDLIDPATGKVVRIADIPGPNGCAVASNLSPSLNTNKASPATSQCPNNIPKNLVTNDMCAFDWTFKLKNMDQVECTDCILRWGWTAVHTAPIEIYETCSDIRVTKKGGNVPVSPPVPSKSPSSQSKLPSPTTTTVASRTKATTSSSVMPPIPKPQPEEPSSSSSSSTAPQKTTTAGTFPGKNPPVPSSPQASTVLPSPPAPQPTDGNTGNACKAGDYACGPLNERNHGTIVVCQDGKFVLVGGCDQGQGKCQLIGAMPFCV
ncbi:hypothetical protein CcCBS67573_g07154 [Chytriomyces confervae]|uniref:Chitin-binding type-4 domain-containing protein n=1 Tax=Chytriomyces confervae TaxID=246404 RepID=A0A507EZB9_9FUNG|nr:hypothetical protein CcCBS67573_g07154 [Chytriomyces confervae]